MTSNAPKAVEAYYAAERAHDANNLDGDAYIAALHLLDDWQPSCPSDFVHKFIALHHDGNSPNHDRLKKLIEQARKVIAPSDASAWSEAAKAEQVARNAAEQFHAENVQPVSDAHEAGAATLDAAIAQEEAYGQFTSAHYDAMAALFQMPAPDWPAVIYKLRIGVDDWFFDGSSESLAALQIIRGDVERLAAFAPDRGEWAAAMRALEKASNAFSAHEAIAPASDALDDLCNAVTDAEDELFKMDAPSLHAALWKLNHLQQEATVSSLTPDQIRQVSTDIRRLMGEA